MEKRFWSKVARTDGCWVWLGQLTGSGRKTPEFQWKRRHLRARRVAWELTNGPMPKGHQIVLTCGERRCVRPEHLTVVPAAKARTTRY